MKENRKWIKVWEWFLIFFALIYISACAGLGYYSLVGYRFLSYMFGSVVSMTFSYLIMTLKRVENAKRPTNKKR